MATPDPDATLHYEPTDPKLHALFAPVLAHGSRWCAPNLDTICAFLRIGDLELPLTVNDTQWGNSWVCSPFTHYVSYAQQEIAHASPAALAWPMNFWLRIVGRWLRRAEFNKVVMVNNWLMSTNPWPSWSGERLLSAVCALRRQWPHHALVFRSLNERADGPLLQALRAVGARLIPSRQIWWFAPNSPTVKGSRALKKDRALLQRPDLEHVDHTLLKPEDFPALTALYHDLYLKKYSQHNPAYSTEWLRHLWQNDLLRFTALRKPGGPLIGVEACGEIYGTLVSPVVGYDLTQSPDLGLYRRLAAIPVLAAQREGLPLNLSAGVGHFKAMRGGEPVMEYLAVIDGHLPTTRRAPWRLVEALSRGLLAPIVKWRRL